MAKGPIVDGFFLGPMTILIVGGGDMRAEGALLLNVPCMLSMGLWRLETFKSETGTRDDAVAAWLASSCR